MSKASSSNAVILLIVSSVVCAAGCNSDVFLVEDEAPKNLSAIVDGDGGEVEFTLPRSGALHIGLGGITVSQQYVTYFSESGAIISPDSPASEVGSIVYRSDFAKFEIIRKDRKLVLKSVYNTLRRDLLWPVWIEYPYGMWHIDVTANPGAPIRCDEVVYADDSARSFEDSLTTTLKVSNDGSQPSSLVIQPYRNALPSVDVRPLHSADRWILGDSVGISVPVFSGGQWILQEMEIAPGIRHTYTDPGLTISEKVEIPPATRMVVSTKVRFTGVEISGEMHLRNVLADISFHVPVSVTSLYPVGYEITVEDAR